MKKLDIKEASGVQENIEYLAQRFPHIVTESYDAKGRVRRKVNFDALRQELTDSVVAGPQERYHLNWPGKMQALLKSNEAVDGTLRPCRTESVNFDATQNVFIEGDNLKVLKLLKNAYLAKIKMIYIDPPYNTGQDFIYRDNFKQKSSDYHLAAAQKDAQGEQLVANLDGSGRFHSDWCSMMYSRLKVARYLLRDDGVIFISIDDNEVHNLRKICDEVFGADNFVAQMVWAAGRKNDSRFVSVSHEYIVTYAKSLENLKIDNIKWRQKKRGTDEIEAEHQRLKKIYGSDYEAISTDLKSWYKALKGGHPAKDHSHYCRVDEKGIFFPGPISWPGGGGPRYKVLHPVTNKPVKIPSPGWRFSKKATMEAMIQEGRIYFGADESTVPTVKAYLDDKQTQVPYSVFYQDGRAASKRLRNLMGGDVFEFPKDETIIKDLIDMVTSKLDAGSSNSGANFLHADANVLTRKGQNDIVLDFFAGSGTTAHAVMQLNAEDGGQRKFIMVQLPEECNKSQGLERSGATSGQVAFNNEVLIKSENRQDKAQVVASRMGGATSGARRVENYSTIADIGRERIRRAGVQIQENFIDKERHKVGSTREDGVSQVIEKTKQNIQLNKNSASGLDTGFRSFKLDTSNIVDFSQPARDVQQSGLELMGESIKPDRSEEDLLFQVLLQEGLPLHVQVHTKKILDCRVFYVLKQEDDAQDKNIKSNNTQASDVENNRAARVSADKLDDKFKVNHVEGVELSSDDVVQPAQKQRDISLMLCLGTQTQITKSLILKLIEHRPVKIIFREAVFENDSQRVNVDQIFKQLSPSTRVEVI